MTSSLHRTQVDLSGLMRVLSEALYSTPFVALRELVQNGHDSCTRRRMESESAFTATIEVHADAEMIRITDTGAGLTEAEIHAYLTTVGTGYTRKLRDAGHSEALIGYFGLGFLSAFAVSDRVEVWTCSYQQPDQAFRFVSRSGETYSVEPAPARPIGTEVRLYLRPDLEELTDPDQVQAWLRRYCCLLEIPVFFNDVEQVNGDTPTWRLSDLHPLQKRRAALDFARRFETRFEPITTINIHAPKLGLSGMLWIQDGASYASSDQRQLSVFVRGMLISTDERELLPSWAGFVGGVIESTQLRPTASRESLCEDEHWHAVATQLRGDLIDGLAQMARSDAANWRRTLSRHNEALLGAALVDPRLFDLLSPEVTLPTTEGDLRLDEIVKRSAGRLHVSQDVRGSGVETVLLRALKRPVIQGARYAALPFAQRYANERGLGLVLLGTDSGDRQLFQTGDIDAALLEPYRTWFAASDREVQLCRFAPASLPFAQVTNRDVDLKRRIEHDEADRRIGQAILGLARQFTKKIDEKPLLCLYLNLDNRLIAALPKLSDAQRDLALALLMPMLTLSAESNQGGDMEQALSRFTDAALALFSIEEAA